MTARFDMKDRMWEIRVQPYDIITYIDGENPDKRKVGQVYDVHSSMCTAGRITMYEVRGADFEDVEEVDNYQDPKVASPGMVAEYRAAVAQWAKDRHAAGVAARGGG